MTNSKKNENPPCQLCGSPSQLKYKDFQGYQLGMKFNIYACDTCVTSFSMPRADTSKIYDAIYSNGKNVPGYNRYWSYVNEVKTADKPLHYLANSEEAYWGIQQALTTLVPSKDSAKILELGSGLGYLTYSLKEEGYNIEGLDISSEAIAQAKKNFGDFYVCRNLYDYALEKPNTYDIVILTEVIEHIEEPISFIASILKLLKKGGHIIITTPNKSLMPSDIVWDSEAPPVHHWWFSEDSIKYIATMLDMGVSFINFSEYYFNHPEAYKLKKRRRKIERTPILNEAGDLISKSEYTAANTPPEVQKKKAAIQRRWLTLKSIFNPNTIIFDKKGKTLCAILTK
ncbi:class I SAM-dependent methyltransferase [Rasiella sp. SM2506]|uniref:class I SAM-dependent methyltransferase n=1 Tax=Rasiella sp. SM2506 TaxID=3423914 RepID=UPI003D795D65